mmetsp:Transcript_24853/g.49876  ORF Transcript_24853/g.49876 Transcript_24853/m.49876 type:complete len:211 (+) Transcript_24853:25-657(+)
MFLARCAGVSRDMSRRPPEPRRKAYCVCSGERTVSDSRTLVGLVLVAAVAIHVGDAAFEQVLALLQHAGARELAVGGYAPDRGVRRRALRAVRGDDVAVAALGRRGGPAFVSAHVVDPIVVHAAMATVRSVEVDHGRHLRLQAAELVAAASRLLVRVPVNRHARPDKRDQGDDRRAQWKRHPPPGCSITVERGRPAVCDLESRAGRLDAT